MSKPLSNQYYLVIKGRQEPINWYPPDPHPLDWVDFTYFGKVFQIMDEKLDRNDLIIYLTWDCVDQLPSYGQNVVAVVVGDEWSRIPSYFHKVRAVFVCLTLHPLLGCNPLFNPSYLNFLTLIQFLRIWVIRLPKLLNYWVQKFKGLLSGTSKLPPIYDIPQGYGRQLELPIKNIETRQYDVFFAGSVVHDPNASFLKRSIGTPKSISRNQMISSVEKFQRKHPEINIKIAVTSSFKANMSDSERAYSDTMMDTKICLVPRGTSFETMRYYEALRYGCIVITEALPDRWFYEGSPAIQITDWNELEKVLENLFDNPHLMQEKHQQALNWWNTNCSEAAIGAYMAEKINTIA
jgi:hypothetical protein